MTFGGVLAGPGSGTAWPEGPGGGGGGLGAQSPTPTHRYTPTPKMCDKPPAKERPLMRLTTEGGGPRTAHGESRGGGEGAERGRRGGGEGAERGRIGGVKPRVGPAPHLSRPQMNAARRAKDCLPEPPTPTSSALPRGLVRMRLMRHTCSIA